MPLWHVYHPPGTYTPQQKQQLAADITGFYTRFGLPKFYVVTLFHEVDASSFYVGDEPSRNAVRIVVEHIARHTDEPVLRKRTGEVLAELLAPHTKDRGLYCEFHIDETPRDLWMIDGIAPPPSHSEAERRWAEENRPTPY
ncbi:tautomerase family protein [Kitasatospora aureofaciens]|uniref:tautomerase family protein n=1 Tax=Kitasatospora aureofaciens TaxID=1894 RepID=UPI001C43FF4A|nr:tautomerase family protein [Kitasatospora aureofaciens]MBV6700185.1 tautomerase family protein [Kitasatospora aureofaciens]